MPDWLIIALCLLAALVLFLAVGGALAQKRRLKADEPAFEADLDRANRDLAAAHAADRGFDPALIERTAREAYVAVHGAEPSDLELVQVVDRPGKDEDKVIFRAGEHRIVLGRRGDDWLHEA